MTLATPIALQGHSNVKLPLLASNANKLGSLYHGYFRVCDPVYFGGSCSVWGPVY